MRTKDADATTQNRNLLRTYMRSEVSIKIKPQTALCEHLRLTRCMVDGDQAFVHVTRSARRQETGVGGG
jgi:hypothetical protein